MHLPLFAVVASLPFVPTVQQPIADARPPDQLEIRIGVRTRGTTPGGAATELDHLLAALRDSLRGRQGTDSTVSIGIRSITSIAAASGGVPTGCDAQLTLSLRGTELPRLPQILELLASGNVEITEIRFGADEGAARYMDALVEALTEAGRERSLARVTGSKLGAIALILLAIRREVRR